MRKVDRNALGQHGHGISLHATRQRIPFGFGTITQRLRHAHDGESPPKKISTPKAFSIFQGNGVCRVCCRKATKLQQPPCAPR